MTSKGWKALLVGATLMTSPLLAGVAWAEEAATPAVQNAAVEEEAEPQGGVARAQFTTALVDREPRDELEALPNDQERVWFFTELTGLAGETVTHRWEWNGQVMAEVSFDVGADRWRTFSSKNLQPLWLGDWRVTVVDSQERVLSTKTLRYTQAEAAVAVPAKAAQ